MRLLIVVGVLSGCYSTAFATTTISFYAKDQHGSIAGLTDDEGNLTHAELNQYHDYGVNQSNDLGQLSIAYDPYQYSGEYTDAESGLQPLGNGYRYYDPALMRFISPDSYPLLNLYAYVNGNPIMEVDPTGHISIGSVVLFLFGLLDMMMPDSEEVGVVVISRSLTEIEEDAVTQASTATMNESIVDGEANNVNARESIPEHSEDERGEERPLPRISDSSENSMRSTTGMNPNHQAEYGDGNWVKGPSSKEKFPDARGTIIPPSLVDYFLEYNKAYAQVAQDSPWPRYISGRFDFSKPLMEEGWMGEEDFQLLRQQNKLPLYNEDFFKWLSIKRPQTFETFKSLLQF